MNAVQKVSKLMEEVKHMHQEYTTSFTLIQERINSIKQGPEGRPGRNAEVDLSTVVSAVVPEVVKHIPKPKDGQTIKGERGQDGKHADPEAVVEHLVKTKKLKVEHIDGLGETLASIRNIKAFGAMRGGGDTVEAGSNVTITNTNGVKTISATGGFQTLTATETPNGSLTVFTFASATAQPSFIMSDNVTLRATTAAGTVNWTWNAGTSQATMTIPPQDDITAIV